MGSWFSRSGYSESPQRLDKQIYIKTTSGKLISLNVSGENLIYDVKEKIQDIEGISPERQVLKYGKEVLDQSSQLLRYNIHGECVLKLTEWVIDIANTANGKVIRFEVEPSMTIWDIKKMIEDKEGIPSKYQLLFEPGCDCDTELRECEFLGKCIQAGSAVYLRVRQILVQVHTGERFMVAVGVDDTIQDVKEKIQEEKGFPCNEQHIFWDGRKMNNTEKIDFPSHRHKSKEIFSRHKLVCYLFQKPSFEDMYIIVVDEKCTTTIAVEVKSSDSIGNIKEKIQEIEDVPLDFQQLYIALQTKGYGVWRGYERGTCLENNRSLSDYNINEGTVLILDVDTEQCMNIITMYGEEMVLKVLPSYKVEKVIEMTQDILGRIPSDQELLCNSKLKLEIGRMLSDYEVGDTTNMFLVYPSNLHGMLILVDVVIMCNSSIGNKKTIILDVKANDTTEVVKAKIQNSMGKHYGTDDLSYNGCQLEESRTLSDYNIREWETIQLIEHIINESQGGGQIVFMQVYVKTPTGKTTTVQVQIHDKIKDVKETITQDLADQALSLDRYELMFDGHHLEDEKTVSDYGLEPACVLHLVPKQSERDPVQLYIERSCGQTLGLLVGQNDTVSDIKANIESRERIPKNDCMLVFEGEVMDYSKKLSDYNIKSCSLLHLLESQCSMTITVKIDDDETASIPVNPNDTVLSLKVRIWVEIEGMTSPCRQRLIYKDECLRDSRSLSFYSISSECTVQVKTSEPVQMLVHTLALTRCVDVYLDETVVLLKSRLAHKFQIELNRQQLYLKGKLLQDRHTLINYKGIDSHQILFLGKSEFTSDLSSEVGPGGRQITWSEEGLKVTVPAGVVPDGQEITMVIRKYDATHASFIFPAHTEPVSPVYEMYWSRNVNQGMVQVSITHTSPIAHQGCFIQASREPTKLKPDSSPEFHFTQLPDGEFNAQNASISLQQLGCYFALANHKPQSWLWGWFPSLSWLGIFSGTTTETVSPHVHHSAHDSETPASTNALRNELPRLDKAQGLRVFSRTAMPELQQLQLIKENGFEIRIMAEVSSEWQRLAMALGFKGYEIREIEKSSFYQCRDGCRTMLIKWFEGGKREPVTWETFVKALTEAGFKPLAKRVERLCIR